MEDVSLRLKLQDDASATLAKVASSARTASAQLQQTGKAIDNAFKSNAPKQFAADVGNAMESAVSDAESLGAALDEALGGVDAGKVAEGFEDAASSAEALGKAVKEVDGAYQDLNGRWHDANGKFLKMPGDSGLPELADDAEKAGNEMEKASSKAGVFAGALKKLFAAVSAAAIMSQIGGFAADSMELGRNYTAMASEVRAISGASIGEMEQLEATAREYGATTVFSASEAAEALKYMSLAGWDANQSSSALGGVLNLAAASGMGLGESSDMVTDYLSAFGMDASQSTYFADMLAYSQSNSNTTAAQLGEAYRNSAANMHAAGQDVETTTSLLEAMANQGYKGSEAGTALAAAMRDITQKMDDGAIKIGDTSVAVQDSSGNFRDLTDVLMDVEDATDGMGDAQKAAALGETFTADSIKALNMILTEGMDKIAGYEDELRSAGGTAERMAAVMNDNLSGDMANMNSAFEEMQLQVFESMEEPLREGVQYLTSDIIPMLTEWVPDAFGAAASGASKLGNALKPVVETVLKNPQGIATAFTSIGTGLAIFKGASFAKDMLSTAEGASKLTASLAKLGSFVSGNAWTLAIAGLTAGAVALKSYYDSWSETRIEGSLEEHFGTIELSEPEIEDMAGRIIGVDWLANINLALGEFENAEEFHQQAEDALQANKTLLWEAKVQTVLEKAEGEPEKYPYEVTLDIKLTPEMQEDYKSNIEAYLTSKEEELDSLTAASVTSLEAVLGDKAGAAWVEKVSQWAADDTADMTALSSSLTALVESALEDGVLDVEEQAAIDILQTKINNILSGWKEAQADAEWNTLQMKWNGKELSPESFISLVAEAREQRQAAIEALDADTTEMNSVFNAWLGSGKITENQWEQITDLWAYNYKNLEGESIMRSLGFESTALGSAYGDLLETNYEKITERTVGFQQELQDIWENAQITGNNAGMMLELAGGVDRYTGTKKGLDKGDWGALQEMYAELKPEVSTMQKLIDSYRTEGMAVPQALMDSFNEAVKIGAAAGDEDAAWQMYANDLLENGSEEIRNALTDQNNPMYEMLRNALPEELTGAIDRATQETAEEIDLSGFFDAILGMEGVDAELDTGRLSEIAERFGLDLSEYFKEKGIGVDGSGIKMRLEDFDPSEAAQYSGLTATGNAMRLPGGEIALEYEVDTGDTLSGIAEKTGIALEELKAANQQIYDERGTWDLIYKGDLIYVPEADTPGTAEAAGEAADENTQAAQDAADAADTNITTTGKITGEYTAGEVTGADTAGQELANEAKDQAEATDPPPAEQQIPTTITFEVASLDDSALASAVTEQLKAGEAVPITVPADVVVAAGVIDTGEAVAAATTQTTTDLITAFAAEFNAPGSVEVTLTEENNVTEIYNEVGGAVTNAFAEDFSASAKVAVTLHADYSLANPTKTITFGGGATGSATITAELHADGGYFDEPHLGIVAEAGVGEYIIPMDGSDRSIGMWQDAGRMLGIDTGAGSPMTPVSMTQEVPSVNTSGSGGEKTVNLNINGSGKIQASGASKEEVLQIIMDNIKDVIIEMLQDDVLTEGDGTYDY